jgi:hypothetical protein
VHPGVFRGTVVLPRCQRCYVVATSAGAGSLQGNKSWVPMVSLQVVPQVSLVYCAAGISMRVLSQLVVHVC